MVLLAIADVRLGPDVSFSLFHLVPIGVAAWYAGRRWGAFLSILAVILWLAGEIAVGRVYERAWAPVWNGGVRVAVFLVVTILLDRLRSALDRERLLASIDPLTGLTNSRSFLDRLADEVERSKRYGDPFTLAYFDLDDFKKVNDREGHAEGDRLLRVVAEAMRNSTRKTDLVARLGGDEFAALFPQTSFGAAGAAVRKLLTRVGEEMIREGWPVTASAGAVSFESAYPEPKVAIHAADVLMYESKAGGKGGVRHLRWDELSKKSVRPEP